MEEPDSAKLSIQDLIMRGTIMALIIAVPSITVFFVAWVILDDLLVAAIIGAIVHFIAMGFSLKISKKFLVKSQKNDP